MGGTVEEPGKTIAGVYIERRRIRATVEKAIRYFDEVNHRYDLKVEPIAHPWKREINSENSQNALEELANWLHAKDADKIGPIQGIGIGCFGPFVSLKRIPMHKDHDPQHDEKIPSEGYGRLADKVSPSPLTGVDLHKIFRSPFAGRYDLPIAIQTDVNVAALGEAWKRKTGLDEVVVAIGLDEGTGGGFVGGRNLFDTALHPEMGRILRDILPNDPIRRLPGVSAEREYLGILTGVSAMAARAAVLCREGKIRKIPATLRELMNEKHEELWGVLARYLADLCWTCTVVLSPSTIVLGGPMANTPGLRDRVSDTFKDILKLHRTPSRFPGGEAPYFEYGELGGDDYISSATVDRLPFGLAGAVYLAWQASMGGAGVWIRDPKTDPNESSPSLDYP